MKKEKKKSCFAIASRDNNWGIEQNM